MSAAIEDRSAFLPMSVCIEGERCLSVGELRAFLDQLPDNAEVRADSLPVKVAAAYGGLLLLDTGTNLPHPCPGCSQHGCDGRCR